MEFNFKPLQENFREKYTGDMAKKVQKYIMGTLTWNKINDKGILKIDGTNDTIITREEHNKIFDAFLLLVDYHIGLFKGIYNSDYDNAHVYQSLIEIISSFIKNAPDKFNKKTMNQLFKKINSLSNLNLEIYDKDTDTTETIDMSGNNILRGIYLQRPNEIDKNLDIFEYIDPVSLFCNLRDLMIAEQKEQESEQISSNTLIYSIEDDSYEEPAGSEADIFLKENLPRIMVKCQERFLKDYSPLDKDYKNFICSHGYYIINETRSLLDGKTDGYKIKDLNGGITSTDFNAHKNAILDKLNKLNLNRNLLVDLINGQELAVQSQESEEIISGQLRYSTEDINFIMDYMENAKKTLIAAMGLINPERTLALFIDENINQEAIEKLNLSRIDLSKLLTEGKITPEQLTSFIIKSSQSGKINYTKDEIDKLFNLEGSESNKNVPQKSLMYFELIKAGIYPEDEILDVYAKQYDYLSRQEVAVKEDILQASNILDFFNGEKIIEKAFQNNEPNDKLLDFYNKLLIVAPEKVQKIREQVKEKLEEVKENPEVLSLAIALVEHNIISSEEAKVIINTENEFDLIDMKDEKKVRSETLLDLFKKGVISSNVMELAYDDIQEIALKVQEGKLNIQDIGLLISSKVLSIDIIKYLKDKNLITDTDSVDIILSGTGITIDEIGNMYIAGLINYDDLELLKSEGRITINEYNDICRSKDYLKILERLEQQKVITNVANTDNTQAVGTREKSGCNPNQIDIIPPDLRTTLLEKMGCENTIVVESGALQGYICHINKKLGCAILEKTYGKRGKAFRQANATYIVPILKAIEFIDTDNEHRTDAVQIIKNSNKFDLRSNPDCAYVFHNKNWGKNIIDEAIHVGNPYGLKDGEKYEFNTQQEIEENKTLVKEELRKLCQEEIDEIKSIKEKQQKIKE